MGKGIALFMMVLVVFGMIFATAFVFADDDNETDNNETDDDNSGSGNDNNETNDDNDNNETDTDDDDDEDEDDKDDDEHEGESRVEVRHEFFDDDGNKVRIRTKTRTRDGETFTEYKIRVKGIDVNSKFEFKQKIIGNETKIIVRFRGSEEILNYLPDDIIDIAREALNSRDLNITLQEGRHKNVPRVLYNIETNKNGKFLGIFKLRMKINAQIDPETGELIGVNKPWWAFLVSGEDDEDEDEVTEELEIKAKVFEDGTGEVKVDLDFSIDTQDETEILEALLAKLVLSDEEVNDNLEMESSSESHEDERLRVRIDDEDSGSSVEFELRINTESNLREGIVSETSERLSLITMEDLEAALLGDVTPPMVETNSTG